MPLKLFHYSECGSIEKFEPRSLSTPSQRKIGYEWLNGPLVWAIDEWHQPMYLFPRECPRVLLWRTENTTDQDVEKYFGNTEARMVAYVEKCWITKLHSNSLYRYELPIPSFQSLEDAGMWVSNVEVHPIEKHRIDNLPERLQEESVELQSLDVLTSLRDAWNSSLHVSGIRLRNAQEWIA